MTRRVFESYLFLLRVEFQMRFGSLVRLHEIVRSQSVAVRTEARASVEALCHAVDLACVFYFRQVLCLQRSAATAMVLKRHGWKAEMVIGAQTLPLKSHAWVEVDHVVVNDNPYVTEIYQVLERC